MNEKYHDFNSGRDFFQSGISFFLRRNVSNLELGNEIIVVAERCKGKGEGKIIFLSQLSQEREAIYV